MSSAQSSTGSPVKDGPVNNSQYGDIVVKVRERVLKPVAEVFDAFIDPTKMTNYLISGASGPMVAGDTVTWEFSDVGAKVSVDVLEVEVNRKIVYQSHALRLPVVTSIEFANDGADICVVSITDSQFPFTEEGVRLALGQNAGWTYTLCCLKAYLQFDVNLRRGLNRRITDTQ
jgi:uncharacterized protein YndB with AHSA1/START domain